MPETTPSSSSSAPSMCMQHAYGYSVLTGESQDEGFVPCTYPMKARCSSDAPHRWSPIPSHHSMPRKLLGTYYWYQSGCMTPCIHIHMLDLTNPRHLVSCSYSSNIAKLDTTRHPLARPTIESLIGSFANNMPWSLSRMQLIPLVIWHTEMKLSYG